MNTCKKLISVLMTLVLLCVTCSCFAAAAQEQTEYVLLGDSIAYGAGIRNRDKACYGRIVADTNGYGYTNLGVNGFTSADLLQALGRADYQAAVKKADIISISIGGNDFRHSNLVMMILNATIDNYDRMERCVETIRVNLLQILAEIREMNPDAVILLQTLYNPRVDGLRSIYQQGIDRLNAMFKAVQAAQPDGLEIVDVAPVMSGHANYIAVDTIHPSALGNVVIARVVLQKLCELGLGTETEPVINEPGVDNLGGFGTFVIRLVAIMTGTLAQAINALA
ncbi:MAG: hypothetical protein IK080_08830 [Clostridia bacterium]|nr:hypothetical protein [Clostridia bacterium]